MADFDVSRFRTTSFMTIWDLLKEVLVNMVKWFDGTTDTNLPVGTKRWSSSNKRFEQWDGSTWGELLPVADSASAYQIRVAMANACSGSTATADLATNAQNLGGVAASQYVQTTDTRMSDSRKCNGQFDSAATARTALDVPRMPVGTRVFFYQAAAPLGWTAVSGLGDRILAIGTYNSVSAGSITGTWQQEGHALSVSEMPAHNHSGSTITGPKHTHETVKRNYDEAVSGLTDTAGPIIATSEVFSVSVASQGEGSVHNHGNTWRPAAIVGLIAERTS